MNIIELAEQAGFIVDKDSQKYQPQFIEATHFLIDKPLKKFAELVAAHEREQCAKVCDDWNTALTDKLADAIRARSKA
jgi:hypothetical protein